MQGGGRPAARLRVFLRNSCALSPVGGHCRTRCSSTFQQPSFLPWLEIAWLIQATRGAATGRFGAREPPFRSPSRQPESGLLQVKVDDLPPLVSQSAVVFPDAPARSLAARP